MLNQELQDFINEWRLGHLATIGPEGPNVSPKGTFQALDAGSVAFAEIRSPRSMANLATDARVAVDMVDVFARKGVKLRGEAVFHPVQSAQAAGLTPRWTELFGAELMARSSGFVVIALSAVQPVTTPAYDVGATEQALRQDYLSRFAAMQDAWLSARD